MKNIIESLNENYNFWMIQRANKENAEKCEFHPSFQHELDMLKKAYIKIGRMDFSVLNDLGKFNDKTIRLLKSEILEIKSLKNDRIEHRNFKDALELENQEYILRSEFNKKLCKKIFGELRQFYELRECRIGFLASGDYKTDTELEEGIRMIFPKVFVYGKLLIDEFSKSHDTCEIISLRDENSSEKAA